MGELRAHLASPGASSVTSKEVVGWYMRYGYSLGVDRDILEGALEAMPEAREIAKGLSSSDIEAGKPPPEFGTGQLVEVVVNARNLTYHRGTIRELSWHHKEGKWMYLLTEAGKKIGKRYEARDLRAVEG